MLLSRFGLGQLSSEEEEECELPGFPSLFFQGNAVVRRSVKFPMPELKLNYQVRYLSLVRLGRRW